MLKFTTERAEIFYEIIEEFETSIGITHIGYNKIINLWNCLRFNIYCDDFGESVNDIILKNKMDNEFWTREFKNLYRLA